MYDPYVVVESSWNMMAHGDAREGKWRGNLRMEWIASTLHTTWEHGVYSITTADVHNSAASSRLNWRPCRFKWTRPFRRKTKSGFCACAITFQTQCTSGNSATPYKGNCGNGTGSPASRGMSDRKLTVSKLAKLPLPAELNNDLKRFNEYLNLHSRNFKLAGNYNCAGADTYHKNNCLHFAPYLDVQIAIIMRDFTVYALWTSKLM
jgi:hypothetical protein